MYLYTYINIIYIIYVFIYTCIVFVYNHLHNACKWHYIREYNENEIVATILPQD